MPSRPARARSPTKGGPGEGWAGVVDRIVRGGYPEMLRRLGNDRRQAWFGSYLTSILQRDVRNLSNLRDLADLPRLLAMIASWAAQTLSRLRQRPLPSLLDYADLSRGIGISQTTRERYTALLETTFLVQTLPAWFINIGKRLVKSPKVFSTTRGC